ncbi:MAG: OmpW family outer membrane protein, partial [Pseudomonadota bacterium]
MRPATAFILVLGLALASDPAAARDQERDFLVGGRAYLFAPLSADEEVVVSGVGTGTRLNPSVSATGEFNATYMATDFLGVEASVAITRHRFHAEDGTLGGIDEIADGWFVSVTLTAQYRFDTGGPLTPYVGAGVHVLFPLDFEN